MVRLHFALPVCGCRDRRIVHLAPPAYLPYRDAIDALLILLGDPIPLTQVHRQETLDGEHVEELRRLAAAQAASAAEGQALRAKIGQLDQLRVSHKEQVRVRRGAGARDALRWEREGRERKRSRSSVVSRRRRTAR